MCIETTICESSHKGTEHAASAAYRAWSICILQANDYFRKNVRGKVAGLVRETALSEYGKMVSKTDHTFDTLRSGEAPNLSILLDA